MIEILLLLLGLIALLGLSVYLYLTWNFQYWRKRGVNGPKPSVLVGNFPNSFRQKRNIVYDYDDIYKQYKGKERFVGVFLTRFPQLFVIDPELIRDILVRNFKSFHDNEAANWFELDPILEMNPLFLKGDKWKVKRSEIIPALTTAKIKVMYPVIQNVCKKITKYLEEENSKGQPKEGFDAQELSNKYTTENMTNCLYGIDAGAFSPSGCEIREQITLIVKDFMTFIHYHFMTTAFPILKKIYRKPFSSKSVQDFFVKLLKDATELRKSNPVERVDILHFLLQTQEKKDLPHIEVAGHAMTFFIDGTETASVVITQLFHMLVRHQDVQTRLRKEISDTIAKRGEINFETLQDLPFLDQCVNETLRLFPPATFTARLCTEPCEIENYKEKKLALKKDEVIILPIYSIHRDEEYYEDADSFNPDRFSPEMGGVKKYKDMGVFLPFGDGPRQCLGMRLALVQMKSAIVELVANWEMRLNPKTKKEVAFDPNSFLIMQDGGVWIDFKKI